MDIDSLVSRVLVGLGRDGGCLLLGHRTIQPQYFCVGSLLLVLFCYWQIYKSLGHTETIVHNPGKNPNLSSLPLPPFPTVMERKISMNSKSKSF